MWEMTSVEDGWVGTWVGGLVRPPCEFTNPYHPNPLYPMMQNVRSWLITSRLVVNIYE